ncbi:MAG: RNA-binding protein [Gammaproteobacteria bacterium]|nr:RNA-binding protein [Gammaproteobacteria bacterium]
MAISRDHPPASALTRVRLDKWLWAARFYKTRSQAKQAIEGGKVHCDGGRSKPGKEIGINAIITLRQGFDEKTVLVTGLSEQRRGAPEAQLLYAETPASIKQRELLAAQRLAQQAGNRETAGRPDKKQRRAIHRFKQYPEG